MLRASHVDWPSRTFLTVKPARQDAILPRRMTTTALAFTPSPAPILGNDLDASFSEAK